MSRVGLVVPPLPESSRNLVLTGFMATGKTTVGRFTAEILGMPFIDLDHALERRWGASVPQLLRSRGETWFRRQEAGLLEEASRLSGTVIATGGGAVLSEPQFRRLVQSAVPLVLWADQAELERRLAGEGDRPLLDDPVGASMARILAQREQAYHRAGDVVETTGRTPRDVAGQVAAIYRSRSGGPVSSITLQGTGWQSEVLLGPGAAERLGEVVVRLLPQTRRAFLVVDGGLEAGAVQGVVRSLGSAGLDVQIRQQPGGEAAKSLPAVAALWAWLMEAEAARDDVVVVLGGGALLDAAGFAAATYARGVPHVNVPTTILGMADAAVGGKTAINLGGVKNPVGVFRHPLAVVEDPRLLGSLARPGARAGLAEAIKAVIIGSRLVLEQLGDPEANWLDGPGLSWLIEQAVRVKVACVQADPEESGVRVTLNLGHTFAHGLESASEYSISHGDAVGLGLLAAARLGAELGISPAGLGGEIRAALGRVGLPVEVPSGLDHVAVANAIRRDKKRRAGRQVFIVPAPTEGVVVVDDLDLGRALEPLWGLEAGPLEETQPGVGGRTVARTMRSNEQR
ncbi:MAG: bifunctional shikimate kinase/3-dehydroquinate synthase [Candidatus Dormibacteria bacterium]